MDEARLNRRYRWVVLAVFMGVAGINQTLWLNFAPLLSLIQRRYGASELLASLLVLCFPLLYVLLSMPAGAMTDRRGYRFTVNLGALLMTAFACLRIFDASFWMLLAGQVGIAVSQPFIMNGITKLAADWFREDQRAIAAGLGAAGMFIGMALGLALTPALVAALGLQTTMLVFALITAALTAAFLFFARENFPADARHLRAARSFTAFEEFRHLLHNRALVRVLALAFLALGYFNGLTTWLELILGEKGVSSENAGLIGGALILGGILGSFALPTLSDKIQKRKPFLVFCAGAGLALTYPLCTSANLTMLYISAALLGFFFLPGYALLLAMSEELAGAERAGGAAGALMLAGNLGGVVVVVAMEAIKSEQSGWTPAIYLLLALLVVTLALALRARESFGYRPSA